ncbi:A/G-specific adenine glycosylase [Kroppenstedtia sanguinis]|uniref:Adenine DNA glycosylase n=1 Tax=Kroppenstedtia sanguinis TaxID=1380684 RepID=A0ABW4CDW3_9BACL
MGGKDHQPIQAPEEEWIQAVRKKLLDWYDRNQRDLPWRESKDPYRVWVSEIMLQQTRVDTVIPYYERFMSLFPTPGALAAAKEDDVIKAWEGLGYYSRARNLHTAVKEVVETYDGVVPDDPATVSRLKGVGPYTTGAILSIAYNRPIPAVDGNVFRVLSRWFALWDDVTRTSARRKFEELDRLLIPQDRPGDFNQALMELGALICTPVSPACADCPVQEECQAYRDGIQAELPVKTKSKPPVPVRMTFGWIRKGPQVLLQRRPSEGLLGRMWGLPTVETLPEELVPGGTLRDHWAGHGLKLELGPVVGELDHVFSHRRWLITLVQGLCLAEENLPADCAWVEEKELEHYALPNVYRKAVRMALDPPQSSHGFQQGRLF